MALSLPLLLAVFSTVGVSAWSLLSRKIFGGESDFLAAGALNEILSASLLVLLLVSFGSAFGAFSLDLSAIPLVGWAALIISLFSYTAGTLVSYKAFQTGEANERAVINQLQNVLTLALAALLLSEPLLASKVLGVLLILVAAVLCTYRKSGSRWHVSGVKLFLVAALFFGIGGLSDKVALQFFPVLLYAPLMFIGPAVVALAMLGRQTMPRLRAVWVRHGLWIPLFSILSAIPYLAFLYALRELPVSVVAPFMNTNVVLTAVGGIILLNEREGWPQKLAGAALAFVGALLLGMSI